LERRRLDLEGARVTVGDPATVKYLEEVVDGVNAAQAVYALSLLSDTPGYNLEPLLHRAARSPLSELRTKVYELARRLQTNALVDEAVAVVEKAPARDAPAETRAAAAYALVASAAKSRLARMLLDHPNPVVLEGALDALRDFPDLAQEAITREWLAHEAQHADPARRRRAAVALGVRGDQGTEVLHHLLTDSDPRVASAACRAAGVLGNRSYLDALVRSLRDGHTRGEAITALGAFGARITGTLGDILQDASVPVTLRRQVPRVLKLISDQRSVDVLLQSIGDPDISVRAAVLKALSRLRENAPALRYGEKNVGKQVLAEARHYFELHAALKPICDHEPAGPATRLLARSIDERLLQTIERLFRLLGLRYPPKEIYAAYVAVHRKTEELAVALEFLDNTLESTLKKVVVPLLESSEQTSERGR
ncbi:MAG: HEAT repeat domain-containing protein, partial [bacterium]